MALSVRVRLAIWHACILAVVILVFALFIFLFVRSRLHAEIDQHLTTDLHAVATAALAGTDELTELAEHGPIAFFRASEGGRVIAESGGWQRAGLGAAVTGNEQGAIWSWTSPTGAEYRLKRVDREAAGHLLRLEVAHDEEGLRQSLKSMAVTLAIGIPAALVLAAMGGYLLAGRMLAPVRAMTAKAREITAERLSERLVVENEQDEFGQLASVFNETFARLEDSFQRLRRFTDDASHELRTPLTALRSVGEVRLQDRNNSQACREAIGSMLEEADRLTKLIDSLLTLSRADSAAYELNRENTDLAALASDVNDCLLVLAEEKGQKLDLEVYGSVYARVDRSTLRQALINLLDNAIKFTPQGGEIRVKVGRTYKGEAMVEVRDNGPGVPTEHCDKIFDRFYRVDKGRSQEVGGTGLGLAITRWAVEVNSGRIELESVEGQGSTFRIVLPASNGT